MDNPEMYVVRSYIFYQNYFNYLFFHRRPIYKLCFHSSRPFVVNAAFSTGLVVFSVSWLGQLTEETTRPVENVALTTKGLLE